MKAFMIRWAATTFAVWIATGIVPGITAESVSSLIWAGLLLGVLNAVVRPVLLVLSLPLIVLSFGLFIPLVNAMLLHFVGGGWIEGFHVADFWAALWGGIVISVVSWALNNLFKEERVGGVRVRTYSAESSQPPPNPGEMKRVEGRVIEHEEK